MKIKVTQKESVSLIEILADNGNPASPQNPIDELTELADIEFPEASGQLAIISGMPVSVLVIVALKYKNVFSTIATANPKLGVAIVAHSVSRNYKVGQLIPLA